MQNNVYAWQFSRTEKLYPPKKYRKQGICLTSGAIIKTFQNISFYIGLRAIFWLGGGEPLAQKFSQVAQIFTKQWKRNEGHMMH